MNTILVVDDRAVNRDLVRSLQTHLGHGHAAMIPRPPRPRAGAIHVALDYNLYL
jgi:CheY-like chemotaxis protein